MRLLTHCKKENYTVTKKELKAATDSEIIVDYIQTYSSLSVNYCLQRGVKQLEKHLIDLDIEMVKRGILSQEQIDKLNK